MMSPKKVYASSKEELAGNDAPKEGLCRHQKKSWWKMMTLKKAYAVIKRRAGGK
jgi:hypothetical protein